VTFSPLFQECCWHSRPAINPAINQYGCILRKILCCTNEFKFHGKISTAVLTSLSLVQHGQAEVWDFSAQTQRSRLISCLIYSFLFGLRACNRPAPWVLWKIGLANQSVLNTSHIIKWITSVSPCCIRYGFVAARTQWRYFCGQKEPFAFLVSGNYAHVLVRRRYYYQNRTALKAFYVTMNNGKLTVRLIELWWDILVNG